MLHCQKGLVRSLAKRPEFGFSGLDFKRKPTKKDLEKYDVIWVGSNLAGVCS